MSFAFINWLSCYVCVSGVSVPFGNADRQGGPDRPPQSHATPTVTVPAWYSGGTQGFVTSLRDGRGAHCFSLEIWQRIVMSKSVQRGFCGESLRDGGFDARCEERLSKKFCGEIMDSCWPTDSRSVKEASRNLTIMSAKRWDTPARYNESHPVLNKHYPPQTPNALYLNANNHR